jgi:hypothetical protein
MKTDSSECETHDNISLKMAGYNDIFSSFDPRPYSERALSVDFLDEAKRASIDKPSGQIELRLILPDKLRDLEVERVIQRRLKNHFEKHVKQIRRQYMGVNRMGSIFTVTGIALMIMAAFISFEYSDSSFLTVFLLVISEPAGWFFFWEGLDQIVFESKKKKPDLEFYEKMSKSDINFLSC